jgi:hypothetical protein
MLLETRQLEDSIDSMKFNPKHSDLVGESGDLPTPPRRGFTCGSYTVTELDRQSPL